VAPLVPNRGLCNGAPMSSLPSHMNALAIAERTLTPCTLPVPQPGEDEVLIRIAYAGVNRADLLQVQGNYAAPAGSSPLPGLEVSGRVVAMGAAVRGLALGQEVCALLNGGGYAEYAVTPAALTLPIPAGMDAQMAASIPEAAATSVMALMHEAGLKAGERVLIHGGSSGIGPLMAQIATHLGADVFATVGNAAKAAYVAALGATPLNRETGDFAAQAMAATHHEGVDVIVDILGGPQLETHLRLLRPRGRLVTLAMLEGSAVPDGFKMTRILMHNLRWSGATLRSCTPAMKAQFMAIIAQQFWPLLANGTLKAPVDSVFSLEDAEKAHKRMQERLHMGKILLEVTAN
jgi:NADPH2:quinone reductase